MSTDTLTKPPAQVPGGRLRRAWHKRPDTDERSILSVIDRRRPATRIAIAAVAAILVIALAIVCAGPLFWLFKAATSTSTETLAEPFSLWPSGVHWENFVEVWVKVDFGRYFANTIWMLIGTLIFGLVVATTGGYGLAVLKPRYAKVVFGAVLATLFIPGVISLVSLYLTVLDFDLVGTFWAVWLPPAASAINVLLMQRFFAGIPAEIFEAARIDGAGAFRVFFSIVLPMSRPVIGVVSLLVLVASYKEFLWPLLVLPNPEQQPISVVLPRLATTIDFAQFMAAMFISVIVPVILFLIFQRQFLRAAGNSGALKG